MEWIMWRTGSKKMTSICCTICEEQSLVYWTVCEAQSAQCARRKVYRYVENRLFCKEKSIYRGAAGPVLALHALRQTAGCMTDYFTTTGYFYKTSTSAIEFVSRQPNTVDSFWSFALACQCMEMLNKRWYHIHSHQHCPSSVLPRLCCPSKCTNCSVGLPA